MKKLTKMESFGLIAAILVSGSYFYMKKVYDPEAEALKKTIAKLNQTIAAYNKMEEPPDSAGVKKKIARQTEALTKLTDELKAAGGRTGNPAEVTEALAEISEQAKRQRMLVLKITPEPEVRDDLFTWAAVGIQLRGEYRDFIALVDRLKNMTRPVQLLKLKIERDQGDFGEVVVTATLLV